MEKFMSLFTPLFVLFATGCAAFQAVLEPSVPAVILLVACTACIVPSAKLLQNSK
jgi:hypothetical protein